MAGDGAAAGAFALPGGVRNGAILEKNERDSARYVSPPTNICSFQNTHRTNGERPLRADFQGFGADLSDLRRLSPVSRFRRDRLRSFCTPLPPAAALRPRPDSAGVFADLPPKALAEQACLQRGRKSKA